MKHLSLICFFGKCFFLLEYGWIGVKSWAVPFPSSHSQNAFLSSIFHLFQSFGLIIIYLPWWKIAFSARLSSTLIFHLPPSAIAWKTFLIPSYSEVYSSFLVCFPLKKHFHPLACLFENALLFSGSPLLFAAWDILCSPSAPFPVRYSLSPAFPFSPALSLKHGLSEAYVALTLPLRAYPRNLECGFHLPTGVNAFTCRGKWLYMPG